MNEDWIKRGTWDLPTDFEELLGVIGRSPTAVAEFLGLSAAVAMPDDLFKQTVQWLDESGFFNMLTFAARERFSKLSGKQNPRKKKNANSKIALKNLSTKALNLKDEPYDPDAQDGDGDGIVQDGTAWERPAGTKLLDANGSEIAKGSRSPTRPQGMKIIDSTGNEIDYTPKYEQSEQTLPGSATKPPTLRDMGLPTIDDLAHPERAAQADAAEAARAAADRAAEQERIAKEEEARRTAIRAAAITPEDVPSTPGVNAETASPDELEEPKKPRRPFEPVPPPFTGEVETWGDDSNGSIEDFLNRLNSEGFVVFDYETTGFDKPATNRPVQIGAVKVRNGKIVARFNIFVNPDEALSGWAAENLRDADGEVLTDEWLQEFGMSQELAHRALLEFVGDAVLVAHNIRFDREVLDRMMSETGIEYSVPGTLDTMKLAQELFERGDGVNGPKSHKLADLANYFGIDLGDLAHTADADSEATALMLLAMLARAAEEDRDPSVLSSAFNAAKHQAALDKYEADKSRYASALEEYNLAMERYRRSLTRGDDPPEESLFADGVTDDRRKVLEGRGAPPIRASDPSDVLDDTDGLTLRPDASTVVDGRPLGHVVNTAILKSSLSAAWRTIVLRDRFGNPVSVRRWLSGRTPEEVAERLDSTEEVLREFYENGEFALDREFKMITAHNLGQRLYREFFPREQLWDLISALAPEERRQFIENESTVQYSDGSPDEIIPPYALGVTEDGELDFYANIDSMDTVYAVGQDSPLYDELLAEVAARHLLASWSKTSNDDELALAIQEIISETFHVGTYEPWDYGSEARAERVAELVRRHQAVVRAMVLAQYEETQEVLRSQNISTIRLFRGMHFEGGPESGSKLVDDILRHVSENPDEQLENYIQNYLLSLRPASSFSYNSGTAKNFAFGFSSEDLTSDQPGAIISAEVPIERILSFAGSGFGCLDEGEMVVLGGDTEALLFYGMRPWLGRGKAAAETRRRMAYKAAIERYAPAEIRNNYNFELRTFSDGTGYIALTSKHGSMPELHILVNFGVSNEWIEEDLSRAVIGNLIDIPAELLAVHPSFWGDEVWREILDEATTDNWTQIRSGVKQLASMLPRSWALRHETISAEDLEFSSEWLELHGGGGYPGRDNKFTTTLQTVLDQSGGWSVKEGQVGKLIDRMLGHVVDKTITRHRADDPIELRPFFDSPLDKDVRPSLVGNDGGPIWVFKDIRSYQDGIWRSREDIGTGRAQYISSFLQWVDDPNYDKTSTHEGFLIEVTTNTDLEDSSEPMIAIRIPLDFSQFIDYERGDPIDTEIVFSMSRDEYMSGLSPDFDVQEALREAVARAVRRRQEWLKQHAAYQNEKRQLRERYEGALPDDIVELRARIESSGPDGPLSPVSPLIQEGITLKTIGDDREEATDKFLRSLPNPTIVRKATASVIRFYAEEAKKRGEETFIDLFGDGHTLWRVGSPWAYDADEALDRILSIEGEEGEEGTPERIAWWANADWLKAEASRVVGQLMAETLDIEEVISFLRLPRMFGSFVHVGGEVNDEDNLVEILGDEIGDVKASSRLPVISMEEDGMISVIVGAHVDFYGSIFIDESSPRYRELLFEYAANVLIKSWSESSNVGPLAGAIQATVERVFKMSSAEGWDYGSRQAEVDRIIETHGRVLEEFVLAQYAATQRLLTQFYPESISLLRGVKLDSSGTGAGTQLFQDIAFAPKTVDRTMSGSRMGLLRDHPLSLRPASSTAFSPGHAISFSGTQSDSSVSGAIMVMSVPRDRILSIPMSGNGCYNEDEVVVLGGGDIRGDVFFAVGEEWVSRSSGHVIATALQKTFPSGSAQNRLSVTSLPEVTVSSGGKNLKRPILALQDVDPVTGRKTIFPLFVLNDPVVSTTEESPVPLGYDFDSVAIPGDDGGTFGAQVVPKLDPGVELPDIFSDIESWDEQTWVDVLSEVQKILGDRTDVERTSEELIQAMAPTGWIVAGSQGRFFGASGEPPWSDVSFFDSNGSVNWDHVGGSIVHHQATFLTSIYGDSWQVTNPSDGSIVDWGFPTGFALVGVDGDQVFDEIIFDGDLDRANPDLSLTERKVPVVSVRFSLDRSALRKENKPSGKIVVLFNDLDEVRKTGRKYGDHEKVALELDQEEYFADPQAAEEKIQTIVKELLVNLLENNSGPIAS